MSLSFWVWANVDFADKIITVILDDFFIVAFTFDFAGTNNQVKAITAIIEDQIVDLEAPSTYVNLRNYLTGSPLQMQFVEQSSLSAEKRWVNIRSAMSYDHAKFYQNINYYSNQSTTVSPVKNEKTLKNQILLIDPPNPVIYTSHAFKKIFRSNDKARLRVRRASALNGVDNHVYIKNLMVFREYIEVEFKIQYFNLNSLTMSQFPDLALFIGFNVFNSSPPYTVEYTTREIGSSTTAKITLTAASAGITFKAPSNFLRLDLNDPNLKYVDAGLDATTAITGAGLYKFDDAKPFACGSTLGSNVLIYNTSTSVFNCTSQCLAGTTMYPGVYYSGLNISKCNYTCNTFTMTCPTAAADLNTLSTSFTCTDPTLLNAFYKCPLVNSEKETLFYYSSRYSPGNIEIKHFATAATPLRSYLIEIWYLPDKFKREGAIALNPAFKNYVFYSNCCTVYYNDSGDSFHVEYNHAIGSPYSLAINTYEWNRIVFSVEYLTASNNYRLGVYLNYSTTPVLPATNALSTTNNNIDLNYIVFCHLDSNNCQSTGGSIYWYGGAYKNLRVWNQNVSEHFITMQYSIFYPNVTGATDYPVGLYSYYPLTLPYIVNNILDDVTNYDNDVDVGSNYSSVNVDNLQLYNYSYEFDVVNAKYTGSRMTNYSTTTFTASFTNCAANCKRCWTGSATECYECNTNYVLYNKNCVLISNYVFRGPPLTDVTFNTTLNMSPAGTVSFWTKPFGFTTTSSSDADMFYYSSTIKLAYNSDTSLTNFGLNVFTITGGMTVNSVFFAADFKKNMGLWTHISLAYYYNTFVDGFGAVDSYFPAMMSFSVNGVPYEMTTGVTPASLRNFSISKFTIPTTYYGLFAFIKAYKSYLIGTFSIDTGSITTSNLLATYMIPNSNPTGCYLPAQTNYPSTGNDCVADYDEFLESTKCTTANTFMQKTTTVGAPACPACDASCYAGCTGLAMTLNGAYRSQCACEVSSNLATYYPHFMLLSNNNAFVCKQFDYYNFSKVTDIVLTTSAVSSTKMYALQFWIFVSEYLPNQFGGMSIFWDYHIRINVVQTSPGVYEFKCVPIYINNGSYDSSNPTGNNRTFNMASWNYVTCSTDVSGSTYYFYMLTETQPTYVKSTVSEVAPNLSSITSVDLVIKDNTTINDWGVMFLQQIRLWVETFPNPGFLSRVDIVNPDLFGTLVGLIRPNYNSNLQLDLLDNLGNIEDSVTLSYTGTLGRNAVDSSTYITLYLCSESTTYYDPISQTCILFANLANIGDTTFPLIPNAYYGSYSMEFWVFTESHSEVGNGINIIYTNNLAVSIVTNSSGTLSAVCFPQAYINVINAKVTTSEIFAERNSALNASDLTIATSAGLWSWVRCAVSHYEMIYYLQDENNYEEEQLIGELLYRKSGTDYNEPKPYKYFHKAPTITTIELLNTNIQTKKFYFRNLYVFNDFLPKDYLFRNVNLRFIAPLNFPSLVFVCDFSELAGTTLTYRIYDYPNATVPAVSSVTVTVNPMLSDAFAANFSALNICDTPMNSFYDPATGLCNNATCLPSSVGADYCAAVTVPLQCMINNYVQFTSPAVMTCASTCPSNVSRTPGSIYNKAICNYNCDNGALNKIGCNGIIQSYSNYTCTGGKHKNDYFCLDDAIEPQSAFYYSRCYNMPNFYHNFSNPTKTKLTNGYLIEIWFKLDLVNSQVNGNFCTVNTANQYILFMKPHTIYKDSNGDFYYQIHNSGYKKVLSEISDYEWNVIIIKTISSQVTVYVNYNFTNPAYDINASSATTSLTSIAFCADGANGYCSPDGTAETIIWNAAYYRNLKVWSAVSASEVTIQAGNAGFYTEKLASLILYYPFTTKYTDKNVITNDMGNFDHINVRTLYSATVLNNIDNTSLYNYSLNFDYIESESQQGNFVFSVDLNIGSTLGELTVSSCDSSCLRCYSNSPTDCYECATGYILIERECKTITNYYVKVPSTTKVTTDAPLVFKSTTAPTYDLTSSNQNGVTITFWFKFFGVPSGITNPQPAIFKLSSNAFFGYNVSNQSFCFFQNTQEAFTYSAFKSRIGTWVFTSFSTYRSNVSAYFPNLLSVAVDYNELPMNASYSPPSSGINITMVSLGFEVVSLFYDIRYYKTFLVGPFGRIKANNSLNSINYLHGILATTDTDTSNCIADDDFNGNSFNNLGLSCVGDYNLFDEPNNNCNNNDKFLDVLSTNDPPCENCHATCSTSCVGITNKQCSCDFTEGKYWIRKDALTTLPYCEQISNVDFLSYKDIKIISANDPPDDVKYIKSTLTEEYTIDFWVFIYSYVIGTNSFKSYSLIWDFHSRVVLYNKLNSLYTDCFVSTDYSDLTLYTQKLSKLLTFNAWNYVRCGTDTKQKFFFLNDVKDEVKVTLPQIPKMTSFYMLHDSAAFINWGFIFIRNINLWQQANFEFIDTKYIDITPGKYPGLLHSFKNNFNNSTIVDQTVGVVFPLTRRTEFIGYNIVDSTNLNLYTELVLCLEGQVWDSSTLSCIIKNVADCEFAGNFAGDCMKCDDFDKFLFPYSGECFKMCPDYYYNNEYINQCRLCNETCSTCDGPTSYNCTSCNGTYALVEEFQFCTDNCDLYNLTKGITNQNLCVLFDAKAVLLQPDWEWLQKQEYKKFDPKRFNILEANVTETTALEYENHWVFNYTLTETENADRGGVNLAKTKSGSPFLSNFSNETVTLDTEFFEYGKKYFFEFNITTTFNNVSALANMTVKYSYDFEMAKVPLDGKINVMPDVGLRNTTYFIWSCDSFKADTNDSLLDYRMTFLEENTKDEIELQPWKNATLIENSTLILPRFFSQESVKVQFICYARDSNNATSNVTYNVTVVNDPESELFNINDALDNLSDYPLEYSDYRAFMKSQFLFSLVQDPPKDIYPPTILTTVKPSPDKTSFNLEDPLCLKNFCNQKGTCEVIDFWMICNCDSGFIGLRCQVNKDNYAKLSQAYSTLFSEVIVNMGSNITSEKVNTVANIIIGAAEFEQNNEILNENFNDFMSLLRAADKMSTLNNTLTLNKMLDKIVTYELETMNKIKAVNKNLTDFPFRNVTVNTAQQGNIRESIFAAIKKLNDFIDYYVSISKNTGDKVNMEYIGNFYDVSVQFVSPSFKASEAFSSKRKNYQPWVDPSKCLTEFELETRNNPFYTDVISLVDYKVFPFSFDKEIYQDNISPFIEVKAYDAVTGEKIDIADCTDPINLYMPARVYGYYLDRINEQLVFYNSSNYLSPDSPIFKDPIYINASGHVFNDTVEERIQKYKRNYNLTAKYYDELTDKFTNKGIIYDTLTEEQYFRFNSSHMTGFSVFTFPNEVTFTVDGPFFYIPRPEILGYLPNYTSNFAFFVFLGLFSYFILVLLIALFWDYKYYRQEVLLRFITKQILENQIPYNQKSDDSSDDLPKVNVYDDQNNAISPFEDKSNDKSSGRYHDNTAAPVKELMRSENLSPLDIEAFDNFNDIKPKLGEQDKYFVNPKDLMNLDNIDDFHLDNLSINDKDDVYGKNVDDKKINNLIFGADKNSQKYDYISNNPIIYGDVINIDPKEIKKMDEGPKETDPNEEDEKRLQAFYDINLTPCQFFCWNLRRRHVVLNSLTYLSAFHGRYMKLTMLMTQNAIYMLLLSVLLTNDQTIILTFSPTMRMIKLGQLILYCFGAMVAASIVNYALSCGFVFSRLDRRKLYKVVKSGKKMRILNYWNQMMGCLRCLRVTATMIFHISIWGVSFYISVAFNAVWKNMNTPWIVGYLFCFFMDIIVFELITEGLIAFLFSFRTYHSFFK